MPDPIFAIPGLVVAAVMASWLADVFRVPSILLLLAVGVIVGPVLGLLDPEAMFGDLFAPAVSVAVAIVLFEGGLSLRFREIAGSERILWSLVTVGVLVTWVLGALAAWAFTDLGLAAAILLGSILVVSGPTVIGPVLQIVRPNRRVSSILKWESIFIDPVGAMLAVITFNVVVAGQRATGPGAVALDVAIFVAVGVVSGALAAVATAFALRRHWVPTHLVSPVGLAAALGAFILAEFFFHEAGLLATTVVGLMLSNDTRIRTDEIVQFSEVLRVLLIGMLFIVLSAHLTRAQLLSIGWGAVGVFAVLVLVARPLAVWLSTRGSDLDRRERMLIAGVAPRGIVAASIASVFGLQLEAAGVPGAALLTPLAFGVIVASVILYGLGAGPLARRLGLASRTQEGTLVLGAGTVERAIAGALSDAGLDVVVATVNRNDERRARAAGLNTFYGNVLDEHVDLQLEMSGMGRLLALTPNDEVNTLAARRLSGIFEHSRTYQLAPARSPAGVEGGAADLGGRILFDPELDYAELDSRLRAGAIQSTHADQDFDERAFRQQHGEDATALCVVREGRLLVGAVDSPDPLIERVEAGDQLIWLGTADAEDWSPTVGREQDA